MRSSGWRAWLALAALSATLLQLWPFFTEIFPFDRWLLPRVATAWLGAIVFAAASFSVGLKVLSLVPGQPRDGHFALAFATGALTFGLGLALLGHLHLFGPATFWLYPALLLLSGHEQLVEALDQLWRERPTLAAWEWLVLVAGLVALGVAVLPTLAPSNLNYDARWYHLGIAERYVAAGGIEPSPEGALVLTSPHLASLFATWAFLRPGTLFDRVALAQQLEVVAFLGTLATMPALVRAVSPSLTRVGSRWAWVMVLLFPSLYVYDTGLMGGADHVAAWWVATSVLAWVHAFRRGDAASWALVAAQVGGVVLTKYTAAFFVAPMLLAVTAGIVVACVKRSVRQVMPPMLVALATGLLVTTPLWLRNLVWYHNPLYPFGGDLWPTTPWTQDSGAWAARFSLEAWAAQPASFSARVTGTLEALWRYHLDLATWESFTKRLPVFGSLFSVSLVVLPLLRRLPWVWVLVVLVHGGIGLWWNFAHQMRYLVVLVPVMAAVAYVVFAHAWQLGWPARAGVGAAIVFQVVVAAGVPFLKTHGMNGGTSAMASTIEHFSQGLTSATPTARLQPFSDWESMGDQLPPKARVLYHNRYPTLGIHHVAMTDEPGIQYGLSYARLGTVKAVHEKLVSMGVSHVGFIEEDGPPDSVAGELLFRALVAEHTVNDRVAGLWHHAELGPAPTVERGDGVWYQGCGATYGTGLYRLSDLSVPLDGGRFKLKFPPPRRAGNDEALQQHAQYAVVEAGCATTTPGPPWVRLSKATQQSATRTFYFRRDAVIPFE